MTDTFKENQNEKKSIRNIPIPSRQEKETIDQKITAVEQEYIESVVHKEDVPAEKIVSKSHNIDGIKRPSRKKKVVPMAEEIKNDVEEDEVVPRKKIDKSKIEHVPYTIEPAFVDKDTKDFDVEETDDLSVSTETYESWEKNTKKGYVFWAICGALVAVVLFGISYLFSGATITLTPKKYDLSVKSTKIYLSDVEHKKVSTKVEEAITVSVSGTVKVDRKASGTVVLYNAFSSSEQKLIAGTRLETTSGKIFKLVNPVTIPAQKTVNGKKVPGSATAEIEASETGEVYNVGYQDFKLPAYKGTPRYDTIYARSRDAVSNGYSGEVPNLGSSGIASSTKELKDKLLQKALVEIENDTPSGFVFIPDSYVSEYDKIEQSVSKDGKTVTFTDKATVTALLLNPQSLSKSILKAENMLGSTTTLQTARYGGDVSGLRIQLPKDIIISDLDNTSKIYAMVSGTTSIYSMVSEETVAQAVSNLDTERAVPVLKELTDSETVTISIWPWWSNTIPAKDKIRLKIK